MHDTGKALVNFRLGDEGFGIPLSQIREITPVGTVAEVPLAPHAICGLTNLRGRVVTLIDVARLLSMTPPVTLGPQDRLALVLSSPYEHLALLVLAPVEIVHAGQTEAVMTMGAGAGDGRRAAPAVTASVAHTGAMISVLAAADLVSQCESHVIERFRRKI